MYSRQDGLRMSSELNHLLKEVAKHKPWYYYNRETEILFFDNKKIGEWLDYAHAHMQDVLDAVRKEQALYL